MLPLILLAQVAVGMTPGRVLCIALEGCGEHAHHEHDHAHDDAQDHGHAHAQDHGRDHAREHDDTCRVRAELDPGAGCCCHMHVSTPDDANAGRDRGADRLLDMRLYAPVFAALVPATLHVEGARLLEPPRKPPAHWTASDQCLARAVTRLLI